MNLWLIFIFQSFLLLLSIFIFYSYTFCFIRLSMKEMYTYRQKLSNTTYFRRHCFGSCRTEYAGNGNQIFWFYCKFYYFDEHFELKIMHRRIIWDSITSPKSGFCCSELRLQVKMMIKFAQNLRKKNNKNAIYVEDIYFQANFKFNLLYFNHTLIGLYASRTFILRSHILLYCLYVGKMFILIST